MSIHIEENDCGTIKAFGCHVDLWQEDVQIEAEYRAAEGSRDIPPNQIPSSCEITALYIRIRRLDEPVKTDPCHFGADVIEAWQAEIIDEVERDG